MNDTFVSCILASSFIVFGALSVCCMNWKNVKKCFHKKKQIDDIEDQTPFTELK